MANSPRAARGCCLASVPDHGQEVGLVPVIDYDTRLLTEVVPWLLNPAQQTRYRFEAAALYNKYPLEQRAQVFAALDASTFRELPQHEVFEAALRDAGPLPGVRVVVVADASGMEEGADLNGLRDSAMLRVRFERVRGEAAALRAFLLHEFTHLVDLLDSGFGYQREEPAPGEMRTWGELVRDRYRVLWNTAIDGRLARRDEVVPGAELARKDEVLRAFSAFGEAEAAGLFERTWTGELSGHTALIAAARRRAVGSVTQGPRPGGTCPLCGFSTWDWARRAPAAQVARAVGADYGAWVLDDGLCGRCLEIYQIRSEEGRWKSAEETC